MRIRPIGYLLAAGVVSGVAGGVYVAAASTANSMAGTFSTAESELHARRAESEIAMRRASARYATAREQCAKFNYVKRELCHSAARRDERRIVPGNAQTKETAP